MSNDPSANENALQPLDQQKLEEAERLYEDEKPGQAAPLFVALAEKLRLEVPKRSAALHAQAALAYIASRNEVKAVDQARVALRMFHQNHMGQAQTFYYNKIISQLNDRNMTKAASALVHEFVDQISVPNVDLQPKPEQFMEATTPRLPSFCPQCGAPARSDEGQWVDGNTMLCTYCGVPIQTVS